MYLLKFLLIPITIIQLSMSINNLNSIYDIKINDIAGEPIELSDFKDKYLLFDLFLFLLIYVHLINQ